MSRISILLSLEVDIVSQPFFVGCLWLAIGWAVTILWVSHWLPIGPSSKSFPDCPFLGSWFFLPNLSTPTPLYVHPTMNICTDVDFMPEIGAFEMNWDDMDIKQAEMDTFQLK